MGKFIFVVVTLCTPWSLFAVSQYDLLDHGMPDGTILSGPIGIIEFLSLVQSILLTVVLPIVLVGASLYVAYQLFTAEGDETKMKKAWKSIAYAVVALTAIALSYAIVSIISTLSL